MLIEFIRENRDIFAWKPSDMPGVPRELAEHTLNIDPKFKSVKQFLCRFNEERRKAIGDEVAWPLAAGSIVEVFHPEWLANPVLVTTREKPIHRKLLVARVKNPRYCYQLSSSEV